MCVATDALRKLRFSANFSDHKRASGSRLRARSARAGLDSCAVARRAAVLVARCVWCLPDHGFTLSQPSQPQAAASTGAG